MLLLSHLVPQPAVTDSAACPHTEPPVMSLMCEPCSAACPHTEPLRLCESCIHYYRADKWPLASGGGYGCLTMAIGV
jgi:hypothetical protein